MVLSSNDPLYIGQLEVSNTAVITFIPSSSSLEYRPDSKFVVSKAGKESHVSTSRISCARLNNNKFC